MRCGLAILGSVNAMCYIMATTCDLISQFLNFVLYSQAVKRLMTFCQRKFETDPSKSVEYHGLQTAN